jgi:hypothetical protein
MGMSFIAKSPRKAPSSPGFKLFKTAFARFLSAEYRFCSKLSVFFASWRLRGCLKTQPPRSHVRQVFLEKGV